MKRAQIVAVLVSILTANASAMYNPTMGRFMQRDPLGYVDGGNTYQAVRARPTGLVDPFGLISISWSSGKITGVLPTYPTLLPRTQCLLLNCG